MINLNVHAKYLMICLVAVLVNMTLDSWSITPPAWVKNYPHQDSFNYFYFGKAVSSKSYNDALRKAKKNALRKVLETMGVPEKDWGYYVERISGWKLHNPADYEEEQGIHYIWLLIRYPKSEFNSFEAQIEMGNKHMKKALYQFQKQNYGKAKAELDSIFHEYPIGKQSVFPTEKAYALLGKCHVAQGQPSQAIEAYHQIVAFSKDEDFVVQAKQRIEDVQTHRDDIILRNIFGERTVAIHCAYNVKTGFRQWSKMSSLIKSFVVKVGGKCSPGKKMPFGLDVVRNWVDSEPNYEAVVRKVSADGVIVVLANGEMRTRLNDENSIDGRDDQFSGATYCGVFMQGHEPCDFRLKGVTGWNPISEEMCMDVLALNVFDAWKRDLISTYGGIE